MRGVTKGDAVVDRIVGEGAMEPRLRREEGVLRVSEARASEELPVKRAWDGQCLVCSVSNKAPAVGAEWLRGNRKRGCLSRDFACKGLGEDLCTVNPTHSGRHSHHQHRYLEGWMDGWMDGRGHPDLTRQPYVQFGSVAQLCLTLCDPMDYSTSGLPVHHRLPELTQSHVHRVTDAIQPSHALSPPSPPAFNLSQHQGLFQWVSSLHQVAKGLELQHQSSQWIFRVDLLLLFLVPQAFLGTEKVFRNTSSLNVSPLGEPGTFWSVGKEHFGCKNYEKEGPALFCLFWAQWVTEKRQNASYSKGASLCSPWPDGPWRRWRNLQRTLGNGCSFPGGSMVKNPRANSDHVRESGWSLGREDPLEKGMATHSCILAWIIPQTEEPGGLQSMGCTGSDMIEVI